MPTKTDLTQFESPIVLIQPLQYPLIGVVTANHEICLFNTQTKTNKKILRLNIPENAQLLCAFDPNHMNLLFGNTRSERLNIIDLQEKKLSIALNSINKHLLHSCLQMTVFILSAEQIKVEYCSGVLIRLHLFPGCTLTLSIPLCMSNRKLTLSLPLLLMGIVWPHLDMAEVSF